MCIRDSGRTVLSNIISSQIDLHTLFGGVVPEIASRKHIEKINQVIEEALTEAHMSLEEMTAIAVTYGPGLVGALLVGVAEAKALAYAAKKPLVGVHHIEGNVSANFIEYPDLRCVYESGSIPIAQVVPVDSISTRRPPRSVSRICRLVSSYSARMSVPSSRTRTRRCRC